MILKPSKNGKNKHKGHKMQQNLFSLRFRKIIISIVLLFGGVNIALAEESGAFFGIGIGGGSTTLIKDDGEIHKESLGGINYGLIDGYKYFFKPNLGLRIYINLDLHHNLAKSSGTLYNIMIIDYGVNADFLWNFISSESLDFGLFLGMGVGGNTIIGKPIATNTIADMVLNVGLRTNIATNHGLEIAVRVPVLSQQYKSLQNKVDSNDPSQKILQPYTQKAKNGQIYNQKFSVILRYTFSI